ncbi:MAG: hypothetical protein ACRD4C_06785 [Candidatus Acidiferrales bacterium]
MSINTDLLKNGFKELEIALDVFSALSGIPSSTLSMALRGTKDLSSERFKLAVDLLAELRELLKFYDVPISWADISRIRELLDRMRRTKRGHVSIDAWQLLRDLAVDDAEVVAARHGWSTEQLVANLEAAQIQLQSIATSIAPDRASSL